MRGEGGGFDVICEYMTKLSKTLISFRLSWVKLYVLKKIGDFLRNTYKVGDVLTKVDKG